MRRLSNGKAKILFPVIFLLLSAFGFLAFTSLYNTKNGPPKVDTPAPEAHTGQFKSEFGTLTFINDQMVCVNFTGDFVDILQNCTNDLDYRYVFLKDNGEIRYDFADMLFLIHQDCDNTIAFHCPRFPSENRIYLEPVISEIETIVFEKMTERIIE